MLAQVNVQLGISAKQGTSHTFLTFVFMMETNWKSAEFGALIY